MAEEVGGPVIDKTPAPPPPPCSRPPVPAPPGSTGGSTDGELPFVGQELPFVGSILRHYALCAIIKTGRRPRPAADPGTGTTHGPNNGGKRQETDMAKKTETANTQDLIGAIVTQEGRGGAFRVTEYNKGWLTLESEQGEQHKARAGSLTIVTHEDGDDAATAAEVARKMASTLNRYKPQYLESIAASGAKSQNNGDDLAAFLSALTPMAVATLAEKVLELEPGFLVAKYERLNPGQMRMNSGNRIRAAIKRGELTTEAVRKAYTNR